MNTYSRSIFLLKKPAAVSIICSLIFFSCNTSDVPVTDQTVATDRTHVDSVISAANADTITVEENQYPRILPPGSFHNDEVWEGAVDAHWFGIFTDDNGYYLEATKLNVKRVYDGLLDDEEKGERTGWEVEPQSNEPSLLFITGVKGLTNHRIKTADIPMVIEPGTSTDFEFEGIRYKLFAKDSPSENEGENPVTDYKLYLSAVIDGKEVTQLLVSHGGFDDAMTSFQFCGDIDNDKRPDFIIDLTNHYNVSSPALFLSRNAGKESHVVLVAEHRSVGC